MKKMIMIAALAIAATGCYNDKADKLYPQPTLNTNTCDTATIGYVKDIQPIINANCAISGCHNASGDATTGNLDYTIFATLQAQATPDLILADINGAPVGRGHQAMPLNLPKIDQCSINKLTRWVNEGAPDN
jgi:hypothetical protein